MGLIGILLALAFLITFAYRGWSVLLLAPAAASFDQYPNFEKRGEHFTALVRALQG